MEMKKRGFFFSIDAIIAAILILSAVLLVNTLYSEKQETTHLSYFSEDLSRVLSNVKISEVDNSYVEQLIDEGRIQNTDHTILQQVGEFWSLGNYTAAETLVDEFVSSFDNETFSYAVCIKDVGEWCYFNNKTPMESSQNLITSKQIISGISEGVNATYGLAARAVLSGINSRTTNAYTFFGGYTGDGNLSSKLILPNTVNNVSNAYMELDVEQDFDLYINDAYCGSYVATSGYMASDNWTLDESYLTNIGAGENTLGINFTKGDDHYIGGGFFRAKFDTSEIEDPLIERYDGSASQKYWFPGIDGAINLYDSIYVPGNLTEMNVHLHFLNNLTTFLTIGNVTVFDQVGDELEQTEDITDETLQGLLNYEFLSEKTIPIRLGIENVSWGLSGNADVILITDISGSMDWRIGYSDSTNGEDRDCDDDNLYNSDTSRISLAKCLDKDFVDTIINAGGNRMGLVAFNTNANDYTTNLDYDYDQLIAEINSYSAGGSTCIACAINRAYELLDDYSDETRDKYIIVMSDGIASECAGVISEWVWIWYPYWGYWRDSCDEEGIETSSEYHDCGGTECTGSSCDGAMQNANYSSCRAHDDLDTVVHSIGFGPVADCVNANWTLNAIADCGNGSYYTSSDAVELEEIYEGLAESIVEFSAQKIEISGITTDRSMFFPDSYIQFNYTIDEEYEYGVVPITLESEKFGNTISSYNLTIPSQVTVSNARVTSYSADKWTDYLDVDGSIVYQLSSYGNNYLELGDPFSVYIPPEHLTVGEDNEITIKTGDSPAEPNGGSVDNRVIYTINVDTLVNYTGAFSKAEGCIWHIRFEDGTTDIIPIPSIYTGTKECYYDSTHDPQYEYGVDDAIDNAIFQLLTKLDFDEDYEVYIKFDVNDLEIDSILVEGIPFMWGPTLVEVRAWQ